MPQVLEIALAKPDARNNLFDRTGMRLATDDSLLAARVRYGLNDGGLKDERITITAIRGVVILEGLVSSQAMRKRIVEFVSGYRGVGRVDDRLREMRESARHLTE